jgi:hypothetical protein
MSSKCQVVMLSGRSVLKVTPAFAVAKELQHAALVGL